MKTKPVYKVEAGRSITKDNAPFVYVQKWNETAAVDADDFTKLAVRAVNSHELLLNACKKAVFVLTSLDERFPQTVDKLVSAIKQAEVK